MPAPPPQPITATAKPVTPVADRVAPLSARQRQHRHPTEAAGRAPSTGTRRRRPKITALAVTQERA